MKESLLDLVLTECLIKLAFFNDSSQITTSSNVGSWKEDHGEGELFCVWLESLQHVLFIKLPDIYLIVLQSSLLKYLHGHVTELIIWLSFPHKDRYNSIYQVLSDVLVKLCLSF